MALGTLYMIGWRDRKEPQATWANGFEKVIELLGATALNEPTVAEANDKVAVRVRCEIELPLAAGDRAHDVIRDRLKIDGVDYEFVEGWTPVADGRKPMKM